LAGVIAATAMSAAAPANANKRIMTLFLLSKSQGRLSSSDPKRTTGSEGYMVNIL
jgi:hypothetical protein